MDRLPRRAVQLPTGHLPPGLFIHWFICLLLHSPVFPSPPGPFTSWSIHLLVDSPPDPTPASRIVVTNMTEDMLARLDEIEFDYAADGKTLELP